MSQDKTYRVSEINKAVRDLVEQTFSYNIWLKGEISDFPKNPSAGHIFFRLEEKKSRENQTLSSIQAIIWRSKRAQIRNKLAESGVGKQLTEGMNGLEVRVKGRLHVYWPGGKYSFIVEDIDPGFTLGKLMKGREAIKKYLKKHHLLQKNQKENTLPLVPQRIGLITQEETEGYHDFLQELRNSQFGFKIFFHPAAVQGQKVEKTVLKALDYFENKKKVDVVVITRGGGARTDLSWFDNKKIAEKIARYPYPVITGIGHKTDTTIIDLVAYAAQQTPSSLGRFLVERAELFQQRVQNIKQDINLYISRDLKLNQQKLSNFCYSLSTTIQHFTKNKKQRINYLSTYINEQSMNYLQAARKDAENWQQSIQIYASQIVDRAKQKISDIKERVEISHPKNILKRGFSITKVGDKLVKSIEDIAPGQEINTLVQDGKIKSKIKNVFQKKDNL